MIAATVFGMLAVAGTDKRWLFAMVAGAVIAAGAVLAAGVLDTYQLDRLTTFLDRPPTRKARATTPGWPNWRSPGAAYSGQGSSTAPRPKGRTVPYQQTDFVFSVAGRNSGCWGPGC